MRGADGHAHELSAPAVSFDIDSPEDLDRFAATYRPTATRLARSGAQATAVDGKRLGRSIRRAAELRDRGTAGSSPIRARCFCRSPIFAAIPATIARSPRPPAGCDSPFMTVEEALSVAEQGARLGCKEALFTLGERPELRYRAAREWLAKAGFASTLHYLAHARPPVRDRTGLLPHINAGCMSAEEMSMLRPVCASMGLMLESTASRLGEKGGPHYGSPDKAPAVRLETIAEAGRQKIPFTTGILIGIGETRDERIEALEAIRELHRRYGHIQEIIVQNFVPKPGTLMADAPARRRRGTALDHCRGPPGVGRAHEHPGAAQFEPGAAAGAHRGRHQRLGRRFAADARISSTPKRRGRTSRICASRRSARERRSPNA